MTGRDMVVPLAKAMIAMLPGDFRARIETMRSRNHQIRYLKRSGFRTLDQRFIRQFGTVVLHGPFKGLRYSPAAAQTRHATPQLLGSYETCLHPIILEIQEHRYERILDIGCAEGYYAVGLAMTCPHAEVFGFDAEPREVELCREMALLNKTDNLRLAYFCDPHTLVRLASPSRSLILSDCEGYEDRLFTNETLEQLPKTDFLIELHEHSAPGVTQRLSSLLSQTHRTTLVEFKKPDRNGYPELSQMGTEADLLLCELRDVSQQWLYAVRT